MPLIQFQLSSSQRNDVSNCDLEMLLGKQLLLYSSCIPVIAADMNTTSGDKTKSVYINIHNKNYETQSRRGISRDPKTYFIKNAHSNEWVNLEILSAKLVGLTGIAVPWTIFAQGFEHSPYFQGVMEKRKDHNTKGNTPYYFIASQRLEGYHDIGHLPAFVHNYSHTLLDDKQRETFEPLYRQLLSIKREQFPNAADFKLARRDLHAKMYQLLPQDFKDAFDELYAISLWIGNWDLLNFDMENCGFCIRTQGNNILVEPAIVDLGNCLTAGFGGRHKIDSLNQANIRAKTPQSHSGDEDPVIPESSHITKTASDFSAFPTFRLGDIPRRLPFEPFFKELDTKIGQHLNNKEKGLSSPLVSKGFIRGIYRISQITDQAIDATLEKWLLLGTKINYSTPAHSDNNLASQLKMRRRHLSDMFKEQIHEYKTAHPHNAWLTREEIGQATLDIIGIDYKQQRNTYATDSFTAFITDSRKIKTEGHAR